MLSRIWLDAYCSSTLFYLFYNKCLSYSNNYSTLIKRIFMAIQVVLEGLFLEILLTIWKAEPWLITVQGPWTTYQACQVGLTQSYWISCNFSPGGFKPELWDRLKKLDVSVVSKGDYVVTCIGLDPKSFSARNMSTVTMVILSIVFLKHVNVTWARNPCYGG